MALEIDDNIKEILSQNDITVTDFFCTLDHVRLLDQL
jgi:hypothetical protein